MIKLQKLIEQSGEVFKMYHGGMRWSRIPDRIIGSRGGRYEGGVGIYLTNNYDTARRYAKGSRVVHLVDIDRGYRDIEGVDVEVGDMVNFVRGVDRMRHKGEIVADIENYAKRVGSKVVPLVVLNNLVVNYEVGAGEAGLRVVKYFVDKGVDGYYYHHSGNEYWMVVYNPSIIRRVVVIDPSKVNSDFEFMVGK